MVLIKFEILGLSLDYKLLIMNYKWYQKVLIKYKNDIASSALSALIFALVFTLWQIYSGQKFIWRDYEFISAPGIFERTIYSALTYITLGAFLYHIAKFWKTLHFLFVGMLGSWRLYKSFKKKIWPLLMLIVFLTVPYIVDFLNNIISFFVNICFFILYLAPAFGISFIIIFLILLLIRNKKQYAVLRR